jgi:hypothetical protein
VLKEGRLVLSAPSKELVRQAFSDLQDAWDLLSGTNDPEHWDVANARLTAALALAQMAVRDAKRQEGMPVRASDFQLPWLQPTAGRRPVFRRAS